MVKDETAAYDKRLEDDTSGIEAINEAINLLKGFPAAVAADMAKN